MSADRPTARLFPEPHRAATALRWALLAGVAALVLAVIVSSTGLPSELSRSPSAFVRTPPGLSLARPPPAPLTIHGVDANLSALDLTMSFNVTVNVTGGSGNPANYRYNWSGLPPGCSNSHSVVQNCTPTATGSYPVKVTVNDSVTLVSANGTTLVTVNSDPAISAFSVNQPTSTLGTQLTFTVTAAGGTGTLNYTYLGLPLGCAGYNATLVCTPTRVGLFNVTVVAYDAVGYTTAKWFLNVTISPAGSAGIGTSGWAIVGGIIGVGAIVTIALLLQARREERSGMLPPTPPQPPAGAGGAPPSGGSPPASPPPA